MPESLFSKYGGFPRVAKLVHEFYKKVLAEPPIAPYFKEVPIEKLMEHQTNFLSKAMGGPDQYEGRNLAKAHERFNISEKDFSTVANCLEETLEEAGVADEDIAAIMDIVASTQQQVVSNKAE